MKQNRKFERWYIKYLIKSPVLYYSFLILFVGVFLFSSVLLQLDIRKSFSANIDRNEITVITTSRINLLDDKIYIYKNRDQKIISATVTKTEFFNGVMHFYISEEQDNICGEITIEVTTGKQSLLERIFAKAGKN